MLYLALMLLDGSKETSLGLVSSRNKDNKTFSSMQGPKFGNLKKLSITLKIHMQNAALLH